MARAIGCLTVLPPLPPPAWAWGLASGPGSRSLTPMPSALVTRELTKAALRLDPAHTRRMLERTTQIRSGLQERLSSLDLFGAENQAPTKARRGDHPLLQVLLKMRDEMQNADDPGCPLDAKTRAILKTELLTKMAKVTEGITNEVGKATVELASLARHAEEMDQRRQEHEDKVRLDEMRAKGVGKASTLSDILALVETKTHGEDEDTPGA